MEAYLVLENGKVFAGKALGARGEALGEIVFTTAMTGYLETLTDPSYCGQIVTQAFPLIGNYGVIPQDFESPAPLLQGYIVGQWCQAPSNFRSEGTLDAFLLRQNIVGLCGIDTRALIKLIREAGVMSGKIVPSLADLDRHVKEARAYAVGDVVAKACQTKGKAIAQKSPGHHVVLWDFGAKGGIADALLALGCKVTAVPHSATAREILALNPHGIMLSNGPGDPAENTGIIAQLGELCQGEVPIFGICLGHQLLALAKGAKTGKLPYGHRGANQPVRDLQTGRVYITSQNHGYAVEADSLPPGATMRMANANDGTCEGIDYADTPAFSVQFHPEARPGPRDTRFLFERFVAMMDGGAKECR